MVEYLLNNPHQKARLQEQDTQGNTVLHALVMIADDTEENTKFVSTIYVDILKAGVKVDPTWKLEEIVNYDGLNPLQLAAKTGKVEVRPARGNPWSIAVVFDVGASCTQAADSGSAPGDRKRRPPPGHSR